MRAAMIAVLVGAALLAASPAHADESPSPPPNAALAITSASAPSSTTANPCAHRAFCGPLRFVPKDPAERRAFLARVALQVADGVITSAGLKGNRTRYPDLAGVASSRRSCGCGAIAPLISLPPLYSARPGTAVEINPFVAPASHGGLGMMLLGGIAWDVTTARLQRSWTPAQRAAFDRAESGTHVAGIASWLPILNAKRALDARYRACAARVGAFSLGTGSDGSSPVLFLNNPNGPIYGLVKMQPDASCAVFSRVPVSTVVPSSGQ